MAVQVRDLKRDDVVDRKSLWLKLEIKGDHSRLAIDNTAKEGLTIF